MKKAPPSNKGRTLKGSKLSKHWGWVIIIGNTVLFSFCFLIDFQCWPSRQKYIEITLNSNGDLYRIIYKKKDEWYIEWQRVTATGNNKWQWMTTNDNEWYNEWQRMTSTDNKRSFQLIFPFFEKNTLLLTT